MVDGFRLARIFRPRGRLRALTVVDTFTREALTIGVDQGIKNEQVVATMARIASMRGAPKTIRWIVALSLSQKRSTVRL